MDHLLVCERTTNEFVGGCVVCFPLVLLYAAAHPACSSVQHRLLRPAVLPCSLAMLDPRMFMGRWKATAVARTHVVALHMTREGLELFLQQNPLAQVHLRASMAKARAEVVKLEALEKIAVGGGDCWSASAGAPRVPGLDSRRMPALLVPTLLPVFLSPPRAGRAPAAAPALAKTAGSASQAQRGGLGPQAPHDAAQRGFRRARCAGIAAGRRAEGW